MSSGQTQRSERPDRKSGLVPSTREGLHANKPKPFYGILASHPDLLSPVLQVINRAISTFMTQQAGFKRTAAQTGAVTLIQRFGSAGNLNPCEADCIQSSEW